MIFEGSLEVLRHLFEKQCLLAAGDDLHQTIRPMLIILWGTMRGVYGGGQVIALERAGLTEVFDTVIGVSTGAPILGYFLAGQAELGTSIYCEECTTEEFMSARALRIDIGYLASVFRGHVGLKPLNQAAVVASRTRFFASTTCAQTGRGFFVDVKVATPDPVQALIASIALPGFTEPVELGNRTYLDGGGGMPFPLGEAIDRFAPTDVLVLMNRPMRQGVSRRLMSVLATRVATARLPFAVRRAYRTRSARLVREVERFRTGAYRANIGLIWTDEIVGSYERRPAMLTAARDRACKHLHGLLTGVRGPT